MTALSTTVLYRNYVIYTLVEITPSKIIGTKNITG
jgi:hypothetical protein